MNLSAYLNRISYAGPLTPDLSTLNALHRAHLETIPFENIDILLERLLTMDVEAAFAKLVTCQRGGWCYEMNGLFGWALGELGFDVNRVSAGVRRAKRGDAMLGNHLCLMVRLDRDYLVDVGFGGAQIAAIPFEQGTTVHAPIQMTLAPLDDGYWRLYEGGPGAAHSYDFRPNHCDEAALSDRFKTQQTDPNSVFRQNLSVSRRFGWRLTRIRGLLFETLHPGRVERRVFTGPDDMLNVLRDVFELDEPDLARMWPSLWDRHQALFPHGSGSE